MMQWYFNAVGGWTTTVTVALAFLAAVLWLRLPSDRLTPRRRAGLLALRLGILAMLLLALLRPALVLVETKRQSMTLALLVDRSRSMHVTDALGGKSRWETLQSALADALPALRELAADVEVKVYAFDAAATPLDFSQGKLELGKPDGKQTAIGAALEEVLRRESGKRLAGVILLSDGAQRAYAPHDTAPQTAARRLADLGTPLYTFSFGQARGLGQVRDVALKDLLVNQSVYVKNKLAVSGTAQLAGFANQQITAQLLFESPDGTMQVVGSLPLRTAKDDELLPIELSHVPDTPGERKLTVLVPEQNGETVTTNNQLSTFVTVVEGGLNVLYVEGTVRPEQKFLVRSLDSSDDIGLDSVNIAERDPTKRSFDLVPRLQRAKCDVLILGDVDASTLTPLELEAMAKLVRAGSGLAMLGGFHSFGPGGYAGTPLAALAPVEMKPIERQGFDEPIRGDVHWPGPIRMRPAQPLGVRHYLMSLAEGADNAAAWDRLPALEGANKLVPKPAARVLAETPDGKPLLVVQEAGGRVMALAVDSTWRWWMRGSQREHKRFWRQVALWLARKEDLTRDPVWIRLAQRRFAPDARVEFAVGARAPEGDALADATFQIEVVLPDKTRQTVQAIRQGETFTAAFSDTRADGDYTIQVTARHGDKMLGTAKARFLVFKQDLEMDNAAADPTLLASLSKMTERFGGQSLAPEELSDLIDRIKKQPPELEIQTQVKHTPWDTWPFFLLFVGLLCVEWGLRKKWGLV